MIKNNLTAKEIKRVADLYNLGNVSRVKYIPGGMINYIFIFKTNKGEFMVRRLGYQFNNYWKRQKKLEFDILEYLKRNNFPYDVPEFIKNNYGNYISRIDGSLFEVYKKINGKNINRLNESNIKNVAKTLATYHKFIMNYLPEKSLLEIRNLSWVLGKYEKMRAINPRNKIDKLMLKNIDFFEDLLRYLLDLKLDVNVLATHSDFSRANLLFKENHLVGILDFENIAFAPKAYDVAYAIRMNFDYLDVFLKEYRKYNKFSKVEGGNIVPLILFNLCNQFWWVYLDMKKRDDLRFVALNKIIKDSKKYYCELENCAKKFIVLKNDKQIKELLKKRR